MNLKNIYPKTVKKNCLAQYKMKSKLYTILYGCLSQGH